MRKPYKSSKEDIIKSSTTNYGGTISNVIKEDKKGIEKTYIKEGYDYKKEVGDIDFFYYDERLHIVYEDEEYVTSYMILGIFLFLFGLRIIFLYI